LHIQSSIANQHTQHEITSNQAINKELAIFFAMKNFKMRMKLYAPLIEALTMIIFVIVIGYLIYKWLPSFPWPGLRRKANKAQPPDGSPTSPKAPDHINLTAITQQQRYLTEPTTNHPPRTNTTWDLTPLWRCISTIERRTNKANRIRKSKWP
jgi:hypothetical protein